MELIKPVNRILGVFFRGFNRVFDVVTHYYGRAVSGLLRVAAVVLVVYVGLIWLTYYGFTKLPTGFIPSQDKGYLIANIQLPDSASLERTKLAVKQVEEIARNTPGVKHTVSVAGMSILLSANGSNFASMFVVLDDSPSCGRLYSDVIAAKIRDACYMKVQDAVVGVFGAAGGRLGTPAASSSWWRIAAIRPPFLRKPLTP